MESHCSFCKSEIMNGVSAYGLTGGIIDADCNGFRMDFDSECDIYFRDSMNKIDRALAEIKKSEASL